MSTSTIINMNQLLFLCALQDTLNTKTSRPQWKAEQSTPYLRAAHVELSEAMDHLGWFWWKKVTPNMDAYKMGLIDALHFMLSHYIRDAFQLNTIVEKVMRTPLRNLQMHVDAYKTEYSQEDTLNYIDELISDCATKSSIRRRMCVLYRLLVLMVAAGMSGDDIVAMYVAKNALNTFRKEHGYKEGTYIKMWDGEEDNVFVTNYVKANLTSADVDAALLGDEQSLKIMDSIQTALAEKYMSLTTPTESQAGYTR